MFGTEAVPQPRFLELLALTFDFAQPEFHLTPRLFELALANCALLLRGRFLVDAKSLTKVQGQPFKVSEIRGAIEAVLRGADPMAAKETR